MREAEFARHMADNSSDDDKSSADFSPDKKDTPSPNDEADDRQQELAKQFVERYRSVIDSYFGNAGIPITAEPGGWFARMKTENPSINVDPSKFLEKGQNEGEALFSTFHELEHILDMIQDPSAFDEFSWRAKEAAKDVHPAYAHALHRLYNCLDDVHVNKRAMTRWKAGTKARDSLYPKLFPDEYLDMRGQPRHRQLMYALLAESQRPDVQCELDDEVREAIEAWQKRGGQHKAVDVINACDRMGKPVNTMRKRYALIKVTLEPIFEDFYKQDLQDRKPKDNDRQQGGEGEGKGNDSDPFDSDPLEDALPDSLSEDEKKKIAKDFNKAISDKKNDEFKKLMGVEKKDFEKYQRDVYAVEKHIEELSKVFDRVIQRRKEYRRVLRRRTKEGVMLDPRMAATAVAEIQSGNLEPEAMLDFEKKETVRNKPNRLEFTLVCDGSGSMGSGMKTTMQRRMAVLSMEAFAAFQERVQKERRGGNDDNLQIATELRVFSNNDEEVKALGAGLNHEDRVRLHKRLTDLPGGGNNEPATFKEIEDGQFSGERLEALRKGELKKIIVFLTDGQTDVSAIQSAIASLHEQVTGNPNETCDNLVVAGIGFDDGESAVETYAPNGHFAERYEDTPRIFSEIVENVLEDF